MTPAPPANLSETNVQVAGVDEADLIKVSGNDLYAVYSPPSVNYPSVGIVQADAIQYPILPSTSVLKHFRLDSPATLLSQTNLPSGTNWDALYQHGEQQLIVQGSSSSPRYSTSKSSYWWGGGAVEYRALDTTGDDLQQASWRVSIDGNLVGSRRIGDTLYVVTEYGAPYIHPVGGEGGNIEALTLADWLPHWRLNGVTQGTAADANSCYDTAVATQRASTRVTTLLAIDLNQPENTASSCVFGTAETLYVSRDAVYVATTQQNYPGLEASIDTPFPATMYTNVHKFSFDSGIEYQGGLQIEGHLGWHPQQRSYRMGERDGVLSVVTTSGSGWRGDQRHQLYMLADKGDGLALQSALPNKQRPAAIGKPGERIYGTRAVGDRMYVVTFLTTDPLYVIDVSDATDPFIAGELEVPGFSDYLHPVGEDLLLGIGKAAASANGDGDASRGGWYQGLRLSLFDVSDASNPSLVNALEYGDRGTSSDMFSDFHAFAWLKDEDNDDKGTFALPVNIYKHDVLPAKPSQFGAFSHRALFRFGVDASGVKELSVASKGGTSNYLNNGRTVLSSAGDTWFYDDGELFFASAAQPSVLLKSAKFD